MNKDKARYKSFIYECFDVFYEKSNDEMVIGFYQCSICVNMDVQEINFNSNSNTILRRHIEDFHPTIYKGFGKKENSVNLVDLPQVYINRKDFGDILSKISEIGSNYGVVPSNFFEEKLPQPGRKIDWQKLLVEAENLFEKRK